MLKYYAGEYGPERAIQGRRARELLPVAVWGAHFLVGDDQLDQGHAITVLAYERKLIPVEQWDGEQYHRLAEVYSVPGAWTSITFTPLKVYTCEYKPGVRNVVHLGSYNDIPGLTPGDALWLPSKAGFSLTPALAVGGFLIAVVVLARSRR
jgi:hypothetical protein